MAHYRLISTRIWNDPDFVNLDSDSKLLFLFILSNESTTTSGIYILPPIQIISIQLGIPVEKIDEALNSGFKNIEYDKDNHAIFIKNFLGYNGGGRRDLIDKSIESDFKLTKSSKFWRDFVKQYPGYKGVVLNRMDDKPEPEPDEVKEKGKKLSPREQIYIDLLCKHVDLAQGNGFFPTYDLSKNEFKETLLKTNMSMLNAAWKNTAKHFPGEDTFEILSSYIEWFNDPALWYVQNDVYGFSQLFPQRPNTKLIDMINKSRARGCTSGDEIEIYNGPKAE